NLARRNLEWLMDALMRFMDRPEAGPSNACIGVSYCDARYVELALPNIGGQVSIQWWIWEDDETTLFETFEEMMDLLKEAFVAIFAHVRRAADEGEDAPAETSGPT